MKTKVCDFFVLTDDELQNVNGGLSGDFLYKISYGISYVYHSTINAISDATSAVGAAIVSSVEAQAGRIYPVI